MLKTLTVWRPLLPLWVQLQSILCQAGLSHHLYFLISGHSDAQDWASECLDVKITNDGLTLSGTGCFIAVLYCNRGRQGVKGYSSYASFQMDSISSNTALHYQTRHDSRGSGSHTWHDLDFSFFTVSRTITLFYFTDIYLTNMHLKLKLKSNW